MLQNAYVYAKEFMTKRMHALHLALYKDEPSSEEKISFRCNCSNAQLVKRAKYSRHG